MPKQNSRSLLSLSLSHTRNALSLSFLPVFTLPAQSSGGSSGCASGILFPSLVRKYPSTAPQAASFGRLLTSFWELKTISRFQVYRYANATTYMLTGSKRSKLRSEITSTVLVLGSLTRDNASHVAGDPQISTLSEGAQMKSIF